MDLNNFAMKSSGILFVILAIFALITAYQTPKDKAAVKIAFGIAAAILLMWGTGLLNADYFISLMNVKDAYPTWTDSTDNGQLLQKNEEAEAIKPVPKFGKYSVFSENTPDTLAPTGNMGESVPTNGNPYLSIMPSTQPATVASSEAVPTAAVPK